MEGPLCSAQEVAEQSCEVNDVDPGPRFLIWDGSVVLTVGRTHTSVREAERGGR